MKHTPLSDDKLAESWLLPAGQYVGEVIDAQETVSKAGNEQLEIKLDVDGRHIYDYISPHYMHHKYKHFFKAAGKLDVYEKGEYDAADILRWRVGVVLDVQKQKDYDPKNIVKDYVEISMASATATARTTAKAKSTSTATVTADDDDLPF